MSNLRKIELLTFLTWTQTMLANIRKIHSENSLISCGSPMAVGRIWVKYFFGKKKQKTTIKIVSTISKMLTAVHDKCLQQGLRRHPRLSGRVEGNVGHASYEDVGSTASTALGLPYLGSIMKCLCCFSANFSAQIFCKCKM